MNFSTRFLKKFSQTEWWKDMILKDVIDSPSTMYSLFDYAFNDKTHRNYKNFRNLNDRINHYIHFHVLYKDKEPVAFSGMFIHPVFKNFVRICDRTYYYPEYRSNSLQRPKIDAASRFFIPLQYKLAYEHNLKPFLSIQENNRRASLIWLIDHVNKLNSLDLVILHGLRFVGLKNISSDLKLWHNIACSEKDAQELSELLPKPF